MSRKPNKLFIGIGLMALLSVSAHASPACFKDKKAFNLADDVVSWTMPTVPGSECIQGLRWSYMQIYNVQVLKAPKNGKLVIVGSGFRYYADPDSREADSFTLVVLGKNRRTPGQSVLDIAVTYPVETLVSELPQQN
jgi:hypothetical protein